jgi:hypothetical protein
MLRNGTRNLRKGFNGCLNFAFEPPCLQVGRRARNIGQEFRDGAAVTGTVDALPRCPWGFDLVPGQRCGHGWGAGRTEA